MKLSKPSSSKTNWQSPLRRAQLLSVSFLLVLSFGGGFVGGWAAIHFRNGNLNTNSQKQVISSESSLISQIAKDVGPSVVSVNVTGASSRTSIFGQSSGTQKSAGTGFIVSSDGVIVTNRHVVPAGTTSVGIVLSDGTHLDDVAVLGRTGSSDPLDVAFLKVKDAKGKTFKPVKLGDSGKMQVGDKVVAIGNALGQFQNTVTSGIISGYGRDVEAGDVAGSTTEQLQDLFQTDAAINEGNSGGPLVNINGEVIGMNTAVAGNAQNIGFAIPVNDLSGLIKSVLATGKLERPYLGVHYISITDDYATAKNLPVKRGAFISTTSNSVISGSPAADAGLEPGDIITKVNNTNIDENNSLSTLLGRYPVGQKVSLTIVRDSKTQTVSATLGAAPQV
ncbi:MAG: trypsin-like peptidase domain-containing protein [Candidatus Saccharibacteria bacterium]